MLMNVILILNKEVKRFEIITNLPDEIIEDAEKVENFLLEKGYDLNKIEWVSDEVSSSHSDGLQELYEKSIFYTGLDIKNYLIVRQYPYLCYL